MDTTPHAGMTLGNSGIRAWTLAALSSSLLLAACSGGGAASESVGTGHSLVRVSNGFAELLPHKTYRAETVGQPGGGQVISIRTLDDLFDNVSEGNPIHPVPVYPELAVLPNGEPGNHFIYAEFSSALYRESILTGAPGLVESNSFSGSIIVSAVDPQTGSSTVIRGRAFLNGSTYAGSPTGSPSQIPWQEWVTETGELTAVDNDGDGEPDGKGFPGTDDGSLYDNRFLVSPNILVFVVDDDNNLSTHETFPSGVQIRMEIKTSVQDESLRALSQAATACTTVGEDDLAPEALSTPPPTSIPLVTPGGGEENVDPLTTIQIDFTEPLQPHTLGDLLSEDVPSLSSVVTISFGPSTSQVNLPFHIQPLSPFDLTRWEFVPIFNFPGSGPAFAECGVFNRVDVSIRAGNLSDLTGNFNSQAGSTYFLTGEGPGLVNVPVTPDAIYLGRSGGNPSLSVIDLNGFGQGTGNPTFDPANPIVQGNTNYPNNPNVKIQGTTMRPALAAGTCTIDGGSEGVFTLARDSSLDDRIVRSPVMQSVGDMMLGFSLDVAFNNAPAPFGCQGASGGNLCAADGFKQITTVIDGSTLSPAATNPQGTQILIDGGPNMVSWGAHPNPPPLIYPPTCISPYIGGQEPTSIDTLVLAFNLLVPGDPFGNPDVGAPPTGLLSTQSNSFFQGPSLPATNVNNCSVYGLRQQIGHFLYIVDRARNEILVLNSNRMTVIDRIVVPDPTTLAIGTNLDLLAVSSQSTDSVTFIDIDPASSSFHEIVKTVAVGTSPRGIAWEPGNEDILVCNEGDNSVSIISAFSLTVRKVVSSNLNRPFDVAITPRQNGFGFLRNVYFAYILGRNGRVSVYESGPNSVNGWGYDDVLGGIPMEFRNPKSIQPDPEELRSGFWVVHEGPLNIGTHDLDGAPTEGALTNVVADSAINGQLLLNFSSLLIPQFRDIEFGIQVSLGEERLTGVPVDIGFDDLTNLGGIVNWATNFSAGSPVPLNGKSVVRQAGAAIAANQPRFMFVAVPSPTLGVGGVDVIQLDGAYLRFDTNAFEPGKQSIEAIGTTTVMDYFRQ